MPKDSKKKPIATRSVSKPEPSPTPKPAPKPASKPEPKPKELKLKKVVADVVDVIEDVARVAGPILLRVIGAEHGLVRAVLGAILPGGCVTIDEGDLFGSDKTDADIHLILSTVKGRPDLIFECKMDNPSRMREYRKKYGLPSNLKRA
jgi:hypothetical protein